METMTKDELKTADPGERKRPAYDPNNLSPADEEARKCDAAD